jgi:hypothetical protein
MLHAIYSGKPKNRHEDFAAGFGSLSRAPDLKKPGTIIPFARKSSLL